MPIFWIKSDDGKFKPIDSEKPKIEYGLYVFRDRQGNFVAKISTKEQYYMYNPDEKTPE